MTGVASLSRGQRQVDVLRHYLVHFLLVYFPVQLRPSHVLVTIGEVRFRRQYRRVDTHLLTHVQPRNVVPVVCLAIRIAVDPNVLRRCEHQLPVDLRQHNEITLRTIIMTVAGRSSSALTITDYCWLVYSRLQRPAL